MLEVESTSPRGRMATRGDRSVLESEKKFLVNVTNTNRDSHDYY